MNTIIKDSAKVTPVTEVKYEPLQQSASVTPVYNSVQVVENHNPTDEEVKEEQNLQYDRIHH